MRLAKTPKTIELDITSKCNLRCSYCYYFSSTGDTGLDLPLNEWLIFFEECNRCAVMSIILAGGEPLFREDFKEVILGIVNNKMRFTILSNGTLINEDIVEFIKSTKRCDSFQVSIDGPGPESHDKCRGEGSFEKALYGLKILLKHKMPANVRVTVHKHNVYKLDEIAKFLLEDLGLPCFSTNSALHAGLCRKSGADIQLSVEEYSYAMEKLLQLNKEYNGRLKATAGPQALAKQWISAENALREGKDSLPGCGYLTSCGGVFEKCAVRSDGTITPCNQLNHIELGKINQASLSDIWTNHPELKRLRERRDIPLNSFEHCRDCKFIMYCRGGCPAGAYNLSEDENKPSHDSCYRIFLEQGGKLP